MQRYENQVDTSTMLSNQFQIDTSAELSNHTSTELSNHTSTMISNQFKTEIEIEVEVEIYIFATFAKDHCVFAFDFLTSRDAKICAKGARD